MTERFGQKIILQRQPPHLGHHHDRRRAVVDARKGEVAGVEHEEQKGHGGGDGPAQPAREGAGGDDSEGGDADGVPADGLGARADSGEGGRQTAAADRAVWEAAEGGNAGDGQDRGGGGLVVKFNQKVGSTPVFRQ